MSKFEPKMVDKTPGKQPPREPQTVEEAVVDLVKSAKTAMALRSTQGFVQDIMNPAQAGPPSETTQNVIDTNNALMNVFGGLVETLTKTNEMERTARLVAEKANNESQKEYFTLMANQARDVMDRIKNMQPSLPMTLDGMITQVQAWNNAVGEQARGVAEGIVERMKGQAPATSKSGMTAIDVQLEKIKLDSGIALEQMKQNHEVAMKKLDMELAQLKLQTLQFEHGQASKQNWFEGVLGSIAGAVKDGFGNQPMGTSTAREVAAAAGPAERTANVASGKTPAGLTAIRCPNGNCNQVYAVVPGTQDLYTCPVCHTSVRAAEAEHVAFSTSMQEEVEPGEE